MQLKIALAGDRGLLIDLGAVSAGELHAMADRVRSARGLLACIAGQQSLYVICDGPPDVNELLRLLTGPIPPGGRPFVDTHRLRVSFLPLDGPDLEEFLARVSLGREEFLSRVAALTLTARYLGFRAGFAYLDGWPEEWAMARRPTSRTLVPYGSFAVANAVAGFYPIDSPGGWNILGRTDALLWDPTRQQPALISAGDEVRIVPVADGIAPPPQPEEPRLTLPDVDIIANAQFTTTVGPRHWKRLSYGLPPGGPFDEKLAAAANAAVGNSPAAPVLECALTGPIVKARRDLVICWFGAPCDLPVGEPRHLAAGDEIPVGRIRNGMRGYLAVGSRAPGARAGERDDRLLIRAVAGPHHPSLFSLDCKVSPQLDRVGIRLTPLRPLQMEIPATLPSCGMQFGTVQLHPDGSLVAMGPDHPLTGGYLQVMTIRWDERWKLGQLVPGEVVTFVSE